jgi:hypothetical protein
MIHSPGKKTKEEEGKGKRNRKHKHEVKWGRSEKWLRNGRALNAVDCC